MTPDATVARFMASLDAEVREVAPGEWGLTLDAAGYPLEVGVIIRGSLLRAQAAVLPAGVIDPHQLLVLEPPGAVRLLRREPRR